MSDVQLVLSGCPTLVSRIIVCLPFCHRDARLMLDNLKWQAELSPRKRFECVLVHDGSLPDQTVEQMERAAAGAYVRVGLFQYPTPWMQQWPQAPNYAFQCTAWNMEKHNRPWFWMEADCIPLKRDWMELLETEYNTANKPFMGAVVPQLGHVNGVAIYPGNTPQRLKKAMRCTGLAWDSISKSDMIPYTHNASHLLQHAWGVINGALHPFLGTAPVFRSKQSLDWILPTAVAFHRCKDTSLIQRLRERMR